MSYQIGESKIQKSFLSFEHQIGLSLSIIRNPKMIKSETVSYGPVTIGRDRALTSALNPYRVIGNFPMLAFNLGLHKR